jgi:hypothetical protein
MLSCEEVTRLLSEFLDRPLPLRARLSVSLHLFLCKWCDRFRRQLLLIRQVLRQGAEHLEGPDVPALPSLSPDARERITRLLAQEE